MRCLILRSAASLCLLCGLTAQGADFYDVNTLQRVSFTFTQSNWQSILTANYRSKTYLRANIRINGQLFRDVGIRYRGNSSYWALPRSSEKKSYKVSLDHFVPGQKYQGYATLNFNNNYMDPTWVRETVGYHVFRQFIPAPRSNYLTLTINGQNFGPFVNTEQMNRQFMRRWYPSDDGNRYRGEPVGWGGSATNRGLVYLGSSSTLYARAYQLKNENAPNPWTDLIEVTNRLNNSGNLITSRLPEVMDYSNALRMNAGSVVLLWLDSYVGRGCHNFYLYNDLYHGRMHFMAWDMNNVFGGLSDGNSLTNLQRLPLDYRATQSTRPLQYRLLAVSEWRAEYHAYTREISKLMDWKTLGPLVQRFQAVVAAEAAKDPKRLYSHTAFSGNLTTDLYGAPSLMQPIRAIKPMVDARSKYLQSIPQVKDPVCTIRGTKLQPAQINSSTIPQVTTRVQAPSGLRVAKVLLHWRTKGAYQPTQMFDDGKHGDGQANDGVYGIALPKLQANRILEYYISATHSAANTWNMVLDPVYGSHEPYQRRVDFIRGGPALQISELMAKNTKTIRDPGGDYEDWLEIHNTGSTTIDLGGMYLSDDRDQPKRWQVPVSTLLKPGEHLLFWCDDNTAAGNNHTNFKLDGGGEWVGLFLKDGQTLVDDLDFGPQTEDVSVGRLGGLGDQPLRFLDPSPAAANNPACGRRRYSSPIAGENPLDLNLDREPRIGAQVQIQISKAPPQTGIALLLTGKPSYAALPPGKLLVQLSPAILVMLQSDAQGVAQLPVKIPDQASLVGLRSFLQAAGIDQRGRFASSNGLALGICSK